MPRLYREGVSSPVRVATSRTHDESMLPVLVHIEEHLGEPLTLDGLADLAGFSPHHFHRLFRRAVGEPPKAYVRRLRLERAVYRLKGSPDNVLEIALDAGFHSHEAFTRAFVRRFDITPSEFRAVLRTYRETVSDDMVASSLTGFTDETPLILRFEMQRKPVTLEHLPARHVIFTRHHGYENLDSGDRSFLSLWDDVLAHAQTRGWDCSGDTLIGITHDDPYVTDEPRIRFDACLPVPEPVEVSHPIGFRTIRSGPCVIRRHSGGMEEVAKTFAHIGVEWLPADGHALRAAAPFEIHRCRRIDGRLERVRTDACVPLAVLTHTRQEIR